MSKKFEPVYYRKATATKRLDDYHGKRVKKVKGNFTFQSKGKKIKRKTGYKIIGGRL